LSQAKDLNEMVRIQTEFMQSLVKAMSEQTKELTEAYTKTASDIAKKPFPSISS
jgi:phasin family protein